MNPFLTGFRLVVPAACLTMTACGSIKSHIYDSDNYTSDERQVKCLKGIPETIDVPTHIKISVTETRYFRGPALKADGSKTKAVAVADPLTVDDKTDAVIIARLRKEVGDLTLQATVNEALRLQNEAAIKKLEEKIAELEKKTASAGVYLPTAVLPTRSMTYEVIRKKELYTVDFKRPASGIGGMKITYGGASGGQFFKSVSQDVDDTTIQEVGNLVSQVSAVLPRLKAVADAVAEEENKRAQLGLHAVQTVVAVEYFDIRQPNLEGRIQEFLDRNVNACSPPCGISVPPPLNAPHPTQIPPYTLPVPVTPGTASGK